MSRHMRGQFPAVGNGIGRLDSQFDALFGHLFGEGAQAKTQDRGTENAPPFSLWTDEEQLHIEVDLPGVDAKDLDVTVHKDLVTIKAQRPAVEGRRYTYNGRPFGAFERTMKLPESIDPNSIDASMSNGVLHLTLRNRPESQARKIEVRLD